MQRTVGDLVADDAAAASTLIGAAALEEEIDDVIFVVEPDARLDALLIERLKDHVAGAIGRIAAASHWPLAEVAGVTAETALIDLSIGGAVEREAHALQLDDRWDRFAGQHLGGILVGEVVATLDGVEHVPLPVILFDVAECGADAALGRTGVRTRRIQLREHRRWDALACQLERRPEAGPARTDDDRIYIDLSCLCLKCTAHVSAQSKGSAMTTCVPRTKRISASR